MTEPISPVRRAGVDKRVRGRRKSDDVAAADSGAAQASSGPAPSAPIPPIAPDPSASPPGVTAQILGQSEARPDAAEGADSAKIAQRATSAYLGVEYSGGADRRHRQGRIAKTKI